MTHAPGSRLGPYEIVSRIGAGGMGEVFRARDTRLDRTVAVKTLPAALAKDARFRQRFQREARAISALSHPNICALYDVGEQDGVDFLVMELLEGESLAERIGRGALPVRDALRIGIDIAAALEHAHRDGIVHRDLKPGNVMLTRTGAKLLDFGLARPIAAQPAVLADAPTAQLAAAPLTAEGSIVGTFQYMAPEQLEGTIVDARTDIFALGALLYEMVTGTRAFSGRTRTSLIASIVASTPRPISELQAVPPELEHVVQRCLEKDPDARWQSAHDVRLELEWIAAHSSSAPRARPRRTLLPWIVAGAAALLVIAAGLLLWRNATRTAPAAPVYAHILAPPGRLLINTVETLSISPDGRLLTFRLDGDERLWLRPIGSYDAKPLDGTERAILPFWSPDSRWIGFFADTKLKKVSVSGTPPVALCDAPTGRSGAWNADGVILFSPSSLGPIHRVPANGGSSTPVTKLGANETTHRWAVFLPDGRHFLYLAASHEESGTSDHGTVNLGSIDRPELRKEVLRARSNVSYANGHLLYEKDGHLLAHRFDTRRRELAGEPSRIASDVESDLTYFRAAFAVAGTGAVVFHRAAAVDDVVVMRQQPTGELIEVMRPGLEVVDIRVGPDRRHVVAAAVERATGMNDLWLLDLELKSKVRLTATPRDSEWDPVWSPDGKRLVFTRGRAFQIAGPLVMKSIDGSARDRVLLDDRVRGTFAFDWSDDGRFLAYHVREPAQERWGDVYVLPLAAGAKPIPIAVGPAGECCPSLSPDSRWIVYRSDESGKQEVYARRFQDEGTSPIPLGTSRQVWFGSAGELVMIDDEGVKTVPLTADGDHFTLGAPRLLFPRRPLFTRYEQTLDTDGKDLVLVTLRSNPYTQSITLLTNWRAD